MLINTMQLNKLMLSLVYTNFFLYFWPPSFPNPGSVPGYYWITMETDCMNYVKICHDCQTHANLNHVPLPHPPTKGGPSPPSFEIESV